MNNNAPIGVFDSGLGGLTVLSELQQTLPNESFIYFGDIAHLPYGNKSSEAIMLYSKQIINFLISKNVKCIIIACNTASSIVLKKLANQYSILIIDVISPIVSFISAKSEIKSLGIIGTVNTIESQSYAKALHHLKNNITIYSKACPLFVPIIEEGLQNHQIAIIITQEYLQDIIKQNIDALILACTHYPMIIQTIAQCIPKQTTIIDSAYITAKFVKEELVRCQLLSNTLKQEVKFYVSDQPNKFYKSASELLKINLDNLEKITL